MANVCIYVYILLSVTVYSTDNRSQTWIYVWCDTTTAPIVYLELMLQSMLWISIRGTAKRRIVSERMKVGVISNEINLILTMTEDDYLKMRTDVIRSNGGYHDRSIQT